MKTPKNEILWETYKDRAGMAQFIITSKKDRSVFFLYQRGSDGNPVKLGKSESPTKLVNEHNVKQIICKEKRNA